MVGIYQFPPDSSRMRSASLVRWGAGGLLLPLWTKSPSVWRYSASGNLSIALLNGLASTTGFVAAASDGASGAWLAQYTGSLVFYSSGAVASGYALPANNVYTGCAYVPTYGKPYVVAANGRVFAGSGAVAVQGSGFGQAVWGLATSGTTLFGLSNGLSTFSLSASGAGTSGFVALPAGLAVGLCLGASTPASAVAVGGYTYAAIATGYSAMAFNPLAPVMVALASGGGLTDLYIGVGDSWSLAQAVTGMAAPSFAAWSPDGLKLLVSDPVNGVVRQYNYAFETLSLAQTLNVSGAAALTLTADGLKALVCQPALNQITPLSLSASQWASGTPISFSSPQSILASGVGQAFVGGASGISKLVYSGGAWTVSGSVAVGFSPTTVLSASGNILAAGSFGGSGFFAAVSPSLAALFSYSWPGAAAGMTDVQSQIVINDPTQSMFLCFGNLFTQYQYIFPVQAFRSLNGIYASPLTPYSNGGTLFGMASGSSPLYQHTAPYNVEPYRSGVVAVRTSGGWGVATLGSGHVPTALTFDASGNVWAATLQNDLYQVGPAGNIISSQTITQFSGQVQTAPLGISSMTFLGSGLFAASSLAGPLVKLN